MRLLAGAAIKGNLPELKGHQLPVACGTGLTESGGRGAKTR